MSWRPRGMPPRPASEPRRPALRRTRAGHPPGSLASRSAASAAATNRSSADSLISGSPHELAAIARRAECTRAAGHIRLVGRGLEPGLLDGLQVVPPLIDLDHHLDQGGDRRPLRHSSPDRSELLGRWAGRTPGPRRRGPDSRARCPPAPARRGPAPRSTSVARPQTAAAAGPRCLPWWQCTYTGPGSVFIALTSSTACSRGTPSYPIGRWTCEAELAGRLDVAASPASTLDERLGCLSSLRPARASRPLEVSSPL